MRSKFEMPHGPGSQVVWKYLLDLGAAPQSVTVPSRAKVVHFAMQGDVPTIWMLAEPDGATTVRRYQIKGTGDPTGPFDEALYVGTVQHGAFVWHLFELLSDDRDNEAFEGWGPGR